MADGSLSTGSSGVPYSRAAAVTSSPAMMITSLLARATAFPCLSASRVGSRPARPVVDTITSSTSGSRTISSMGATVGSVQRMQNVLLGLGPHEARAELLYLLSEQLEVPARGEADNLEALGQGTDHVEGLPADGAGGAENGDAFHACSLWPGQRGDVGHPPGQLLVT